MYSAYTYITTFITPLSCKTGIASYLTVVDRITGLTPVAELAVVTITIVRSIHTGIVDFITAINGTADSVTTVYRSTRLTVVDRITGLTPVTELTVVTITIVRHIHNRVIYLITAVVSANYTIISAWWSTRLTVVDRITGLTPVAELAVVTITIVRHIHNRVIYLITAVVSANNCCQFGAPGPPGFAASSSA
jgi:hypothetical protein